VENAINWSVPRPDPHDALKLAVIPSSIRGQFCYDEGLEGRWQDANGADWQLYYFVGFQPFAPKEVAVQLAKTHGPEKCLPAAGMA